MPHCGRASTSELMQRVSAKIDAQHATVRVVVPCQGAQRKRKEEACSNALRGSRRGTSTLAGSRSATSHGTPHIPCA